MVVAETNPKDDECKGLLTSISCTPASPPPPPSSSPPPPSSDDVKLELGYYSYEDEKRPGVLSEEPEKQIGSIGLLVWMTINIVATVAIVSFCHARHEDDYH